MTNAIDAIVANSSTPVPPGAVANTSKQKMDGEMFLQLLVV